MRSDPEQILRRLAAGDDELLRRVLSPTPGLRDRHPAAKQTLDRRSTALVRLAALIAVDAPTTSLHWAVELACATGATAQDIVDVLVATAAIAGVAQVVSTAPRLALALEFDIELEGGDGFLIRSGPEEPSRYCPSRPACEARTTASDRDAAPSLR